MKVFFTKIAQIFLISLTFINIQIYSQWICQAPDPVYSYHQSVDPPVFNWTPVSNPLQCIGVIGKWDILCPYPPFGTGIDFFYADTHDSCLVLPNSVWSGFAANQQYCWALVSGSWAMGYKPGGSFTRYAAALPVTSLFYPQGGASNVELTTMFRWNKIQDASNYILRVYDSRRLNNVIYEVNVNTDSIRIPAGWIQNSRQYWWRVKPFKTGGEGPISDPSTFSTVQPSELPPPSLIFPEFSSAGNSLSPLMDWMDVSGALNYRLQISTVSDFTSIVFDNSTLVNSQFNLPASILNGNTVYYWRVATRASTEWSPFSTIWNFKTIGLPYQVNLFYPPNNSVFQPLNLTFEWYKPLEVLTGYDRILSNGLSGIKSMKAVISTYCFELTEDTLLLTGLIRDSLLTDTLKTVNGLKNSTIYYWRVKAINEAGSGNYSSWWRFSTPMLPAKVVLSSPPDNSVNLLTNQVFNWYNRELPFKSKFSGMLTNPELSYNSVSIDKFWFEIVKDTVTLAGIIKDTMITDTFKIINDLELSATYFWRVKAHNQLGWGVFSNWWKFSSTNGAPVLQLPANEETSVSVTPLFEWSDVPNAEKYRVQISPNINFSVLVIDDSNSINSEFQVQQGFIAYNSSYYWRVKTRNKTNWGDFQTPFRFFTLISEIFPAPNLLLPVNNTSGVSIIPLLDWNDVPACTKYKLQVSHSLNFSSLIINDSNITSSQYQVMPGSLSGNRVYYWRVAAKGTGSWGSFTIPWNFITIAVPEPVVLESPPDNSLENNVNLRLSWYKASEPTAPAEMNTGNFSSGISDVSDKLNYQNGIILYSGKKLLNTYWFEITEDTVFFTGLVRDTLLTDTTKILNGLNPLTRYFWRVKAKNENGWGPFSLWWKFTTISNISWNIIPSGVSSDLYTVFFINNYTGWAGGQNGIIIKTTNGGDNWIPQNSGISQLIHALSFADENTGWAAAETPSILKTTDGGNTWFSLPQCGASTWLQNVSFVNINTGLATGNHAQYKDIYKTTNGGNNWQTVGNSISPSLNCISFPRVPPFQSAYIGGWSYDGSNHAALVISSDQGESWNININGTGSSILHGISFINAQTGWAVGTGGSILYTYNGGNTFTIQTSPVAQTFFSVSFINSNTGFACGTGGSVISTFNGGLNWISNTSGTGVNLRSIQMVSADKGWIAGNSGVLLRSGTVVPLISAPDLLSPLNGSSSLSLTPLLDWTEVIDAVKYKVQVSKNFNFDTLAVNDTTLTVSQYSIPQNTLIENTFYYWRASAFDGSNWGNYSDIWNFKTDSLPAPAVLLSPLNNSVNQNDSIAFIWQTFQSLNRKISQNSSSKQKQSPVYIKSVSNKIDNSDAVDRYWFEITRDTVLLTDLLTDSLLIDSMKIVKGLIYSANYFWRVKTHNTLGWGEFSSWWKFTTTNGAPVLQQPVNNQTEIKVTPLLNWSDISGAVKFRVQVSAFSNFSTLWIDDSSSVNSQLQVSNGILAYNSLYYWRVKTKNSAGWGEYQAPFRFFTQVIPPPPVPVPVLPLNNSTGISSAPLIDWNDAAGALKYRLQVSSASDFSSLQVNDSNITASNYQVAAGVLNNGIMYYWRIAAKNNSSWSEFSPPWNFTTLGLPQQVILDKPANNSAEQPLNISFSWFKASEILSMNNYSKNQPVDKSAEKLSGTLSFNSVSGYWFEISTDTNSAPLITDSLLIDTLKQVSGLTLSTKYYWRVKAKNEIGWGAFSSWWSFTTTNNQPPPAPVLLTPVNNAADQKVTPTLVWNRVNGASKYRIQVSAFSSFSSLWIDDSNVTSENYIVKNGVLAYNSAYYWRVKAKNDIGWGNFQVSPYRFFTMIIPPPSIPLHNMPANGSTGNSVTPLIDWNDQSGISKYWLQLSADTGFVVKLIDDSLFNTSQFQVPAALLNVNTVYYWRVNAKNSMYWSGFSGRWSFKTIGAPLNVTLIYPANNAVELPLNVSFAWMKAIESAPFRKNFINTESDIHSLNISGSTDYVSNYWFEMASDTINLTGLIRDTLLTDSIKTVNSLSGNTTYYWRVKAKNEAGWGPFSTWWKFTTISGLPPSPPVLIFPANNAQNIVVNPLIDWSDAPGAVKYYIQASAFSNFSVLWINDSSSSISEFQVPGGVLAYNSLYYWRVKAKNEAGWGNFQAIPFRFFTLITPPQAPPALVTPANNSINVSLTPALDWIDINGALKYRVQISQSSGFGTTIADDSSLAVSQYSVSAGSLTYNTQYFWRASVKTASGWSAFSAAWSFTTLTALNPPLLLMPVNRDTGVSVTPLFTWSKVNTAGSYRLQVSAFSNFSVLWINTAVSDTFYQTPNGVLAYNSRYFWRVRSLWSLDSSSYSGSNYFFTRIFPPVLELPEAESVRRISLDGFVNEGTKGSYVLQLAKDTVFDNILFVSEKLQVKNQGDLFTDIPLNGLSDYSTYYWRLILNDIPAAGTVNPLVTYIVSGPLSVQRSGNIIPGQYMLYQNYPNPFNPLSTIRFDLPAVKGTESVDVTLTVYDLLGREIDVIINVDLKPGSYEVKWNGSIYPSGVYIYRLKAGTFTDIKKMVLIK